MSLFKTAENGNSPRGNREEKEVWGSCSKQSPWLFIGWVIAGNEEQFLPHFGLCYPPNSESFPYSSPTLFNWGFCLLIIIFFLQVEGGEVLFSCFNCQTVSTCLFVVCYVRCTADIYYLISTQPWPWDFLYHLVIVPIIGHYSSHRSMYYLV